MRFKGIVIGMKNIKGIAIKKRVAKVCVCMKPKNYHKRDFHVSRNVFPLNYYYKYLLTG